MKFTLLSSFFLLAAASAMNAPSFSTATPSLQQRREQLQLHQSRYLKEILLGRCYDHPPQTASPSPSAEDECNSLISGFMSIIEHYADVDITAADYSSFLHVLDFGTKNNHNNNGSTGGGLFFVTLGQQQQPQEEEEQEDCHNHGIIYNNVIYPRTGTKLFHYYNAAIQYGNYSPIQLTPGGALLNNLIFCGRHQMENTNYCGGCKWGQWDDTLNNNGILGGWKGAQASFWSGAYEAYASSLFGRVSIVIRLLSLSSSSSSYPPPHSDGVGNGETVEDAHQQQQQQQERYPTLFESSALPYLDSSQITNIDLYLVPSTMIHNNNNKDDNDKNDDKKALTTDTEADLCTLHPDVMHLKQDLLNHGFTMDVITCTLDPFLLKLALCGGGGDGGGGGHDDGSSTRMNESPCSLLISDNGAFLPPPPLLPPPPIPSSENENIIDNNDTANNNNNSKPSGSGGGDTRNDNFVPHGPHRRQFHPTSTILWILVLGAVVIIIINKKLLDTSTNTQRQRLLRVIGRGGGINNSGVGGGGGGSNGYGQYESIPQVTVRRAR